MKKLRPIVGALFVLALLFSQSACAGESIYGAYRVLKTYEGANCLIAFREGDKIAQPVSAALKVLAAEGTLNVLSRRWFGEDLCPLEGDIEALTALEEAPAPRVFIAGVAPGNPGLCQVQGTTLSGFDVDLAGEICRLLGWELKLQAIAPADVRVELAAGNVDGAFVGALPDDAASLSRSEGYLKKDLMLVVRADGDYKRVRDLYGQVLSARSGAELQSLEKSGDKLYESLSVARLSGSDSESFKALDSAAAAGALVDSTSMKAVR